MSTRPAHGSRQRFRFNPTEDIRLADLVHLHGVNCWQRIAADMPRRNARQCRDRWNHYLAKQVPHHECKMNGSPLFPAAKVDSLLNTQIVDPNQAILGQNEMRAAADTDYLAPNFGINLTRGDSQNEEHRTESPGRDDIDLFPLRAEESDSFTTFW
jgi:hypothetical protein